MTNFLMQFQRRSQVYSKLALFNTRPVFLNHVEQSSRTFVPVICAHVCTKWTNNLLTFQKWRGWWRSAMTSDIQVGTLWLTPFIAHNLSLCPFWSDFSCTFFFFSVFILSLALLLFFRFSLSRHRFALFRLCFEPLTFHSSLASLAPFV